MCLFSALERVPVALGEFGCPVLDVAGPLVFVAVRGLLELGVVPYSGPVVRPGVHLGLGQEMVRIGRAAQGAVYDGAGLGAGDALVRAVDVARVALYEPQLRRDGHKVLVPGARRNVREDILGAYVLVLEEADGDLRKLGSGYAGVRAEGAVLIAAEDAHAAEGGDGVVIPGGFRHVAVAVCLRPELVPGLVGEEAEEDGGDLGAGDGGVRLYRAVLVADDVAEVVRGVQPVRPVDRLGRGHGDIGDGWDVGLADHVEYDGQFAVHDEPLAGLFVPLELDGGIGLVFCEVVLGAGPGVVLRLVGVGEEDDGAGVFAVRG